MSHQDATGLFYAHVWPHRAMILRTAGFLTRNHAESEDLAQETLVKAFRSIHQFDTATNARAWLSSILRNTWIDRLRSQGRHAAAVSIDDSGFDVADPHGGETLLDETDPTALLERFADAQIIEALKSLPEEIRWTLMLVDVESMDHAVAAKILGIPEGTVKSRAHRGRRMLKEKLSPVNNPPVSRAVGQP